MMELKWDNVCFGFTYENNFGLKPNRLMNERLLKENLIGNKFKSTFPNLKIFQEIEINEKPLPKYYMIFNCYSLLKKKDEDYSYMELIVLCDDLNHESAWENIKTNMTKKYWLENSLPAYF